MNKNNLKKNKLVVSLKRLTEKEKAAILNFGQRNGLVGIKTSAKVYFNGALILD